VHCPIPRTSTRGLDHSKRHHQQYCVTSDALSHDVDHQQWLIFSFNDCSVKSWVMNVNLTDLTETYAPPKLEVMLNGHKNSGDSASFSGVVSGIFEKKKSLSVIGRRCMRAQ
jgi:hypothetical protein